jgi:hypothetical protein
LRPGAAHVVQNPLFERLIVEGCVTGQDEQCVLKGRSKRKFQSVTRTNFQVRTYEFGKMNRRRRVTLKHSSKHLDPTGCGFYYRDFRDVLEGCGHVSLRIGQRHPELYAVQLPCVFAWCLLGVRDPVA